MIIDALNGRATIKSKIGRFDTMTEQVNIRKAELTSAFSVRNRMRPGRKKRSGSWKRNSKKLMERSFG